MVPKSTDNPPWSNRDVSSLNLTMKSTSLSGRSSLRAQEPNTQSFSALCFLAIAYISSRFARISSSMHIFKLSILYQKMGRVGSSFRGSQKIGDKGGVERKLSLGLVRSFFALSIGDNIRCFSRNRRDSGARAVRGGYAYAAHYARVIPVIALGTRFRSASSRPYGLRTPYRAVTTDAAR